MTAREDAIEAGARALAANWGDAVWAILDAVEPIIRADERERMADLARKVQGGGIRDYEAEVRERIAQEPCSHDLSMHDAKIRADERERLRAQVEALRVVESRVKGRRITVLVDRADVLALLGGESAAGDSEIIEVTIDRDAWTRGI